jgi:hypothetical protein
MHTDNLDVSISLYELLEVHPTATPDQIDTARGRAVALLTEEWSRETGVRQEHLDAAWVVLRYPMTRESYDRVLADGQMPHPDHIVERIIPDEHGSIETALKELAVSWPTPPPLPTTVSEVTTWNGPPDAGKYLPLVEMARHIAEEEKTAATRDGRKRQQHVKAALHAGHRPTGLRARVFAIIVGCAMLGVVGFGGFLMYKVTHKPLVARVGACVNFESLGAVKQVVSCSKPHQGQIVSFAANPSLCLTDTVATAGVNGRIEAYVWCIDYPKPTVAA